MPYHPLPLAGQCGIAEGLLLVSPWKKLYFLDFGCYPGDVQLGTFGFGSFFLRGSRMPRFPAASLLALFLCLLVHVGSPPLLVLHGQSLDQKGRNTAPTIDLRQNFLRGWPARCIGPANMGGRICDLAVVEANPDVFYVASAGGGVWKTHDGGRSFVPIFDDQPTQCIGAVAVCRERPEVVYVGTGEANPRNSVSWGCGVFRSGDGGRTWFHCGLADTHHIGRIVVHPTDPNTVYVAALGHVWGPNRARGLYKTTDGGVTWEHSLFIDENTGCIDVQMDPENPQILYAAFWPVRRDAFSGGSPARQTGPTGGLFKTTDGGKTWKKLTRGLPENVGYGRCGISIYRKDPRIVYAVIHTSETTGQNSNVGQPATPVGKDGKPGAPGPVSRGGIFRSEDYGETWRKVNDLVPRPFYYGQIRVDPNDDNIIYVLGVAFHVSTDGGRTFPIFRHTMHPDHHALWINPKDSKHLIVGNDGGLYISKDARNFEAKRGLVISQFYGVAVDSRVPYHVYGGLQDNGSWTGPSATLYKDGITLADWRRLLGGDGFQAAVDPEDNNIVYVESQYGNLVRVRLDAPPGPTGKGANKSIRPPGGKQDKSSKVPSPYRFNWNAPILISPHDPKTLYYGAQYLFKSTNRGDSWQKISPDLTAYPRDGRAPASGGHTILSLAASPRQAGVIWVGTDDGKLWLTRDDGHTWTDLTNRLPDIPVERAIPKIECSHFDAGTAYVAVDRHRNDDFRPYIFKTTDYGQTWTALASNLPLHAVVGVIRQSSRKKDLLFAGTERGLYVSFNDGKFWYPLRCEGMPVAVRVDDLVIHPRERELVVATHGRGIWIIPIAPLEDLEDSHLTADAVLFPFPAPVPALQRRDRPPPTGKDLPVPKDAFVAPNPPAGPVVAFYLTGEGPERVKVTFQSEQHSGTVEFAIPGPGLYFRPLGNLPPGAYQVALHARGVIVRQPLRVVSPPTAATPEP